MAQAQFRFYADLNSFLPYRKRQVAFAHDFKGRVSIKDMVESFGVPHTEVALILVNGDSVDFSYLVQDGDQISVYPTFESLDITPLACLRPEPLPEPRFVLDVHLGKLASHLRMLGFDALYWSDDFGDEELARISSDEERIMLTRDRGLLKRNMVKHGYYVRATDARQQAVEVLRRYDLFDSIAPFRRCIRCNGLLEMADKAAISDRLSPRTRQYYDEFRICLACDQIYWKGSHFQKMQDFIKRVLAHDT